MQRTALLGALTTILLASTAPISAGEYYRGLFGTIFSPAPAAPEPPRVIRRHRPHERVGRKEKTVAAASQPVVPSGPLQVIVSINKQRVTLFANGHPVTTSNVSTGTPGHPTPMGVFTVIEKDRHHFSNLYNAAPMPYMQRITWSGAALHEGPLPGRPASHGCVRLTTGFAQLLWKTTRIGARVIVTKDEVAPVDIDLPNLFVPPKMAAAPADKPSIKLATAPAAQPAKPAPELPPALAGAARTEADPRARAKTADATGMVPVTIAQATTEVPASTPAANAAAPEQPTKLDLVGKVDRAATEVTAAGKMATGGGPDVRPAVPHAAPPKSTAEAPNTPAPDSAATTPASRDTTPVIAVLPEMASPDTPSIVLPTSPPLPTSRRDAMKSGQPISVFVSLKQGKLYVRRKWTPLFEMPVTIANPDRPLGTHVFTVMEEKGDSLRWTVISMPSGFKQGRHKTEQPHHSKRPVAYHDVAPEIAFPVPDAREALDRISFPPEAVARIAELINPGSSLIISDNRLSDETGEYTDFIVLTQ